MEMKVKPSRKRSALIPRFRGIHKTAASKYQHVLVKCPRAKQASVQTIVKLIQPIIEGA